LAVIGADDIVDAAELVPPLTTISPQKRDMGQHVARILVELFEESGHPVCKQVVLQPSLVMRESTYGFWKNADPVAALEAGDLSALIHEEVIS